MCVGDARTQNCFPKTQNIFENLGTTREGWGEEREGERAREHEMEESASAPGKKQLDASLFMANSWTADKFQLQLAHTSALWYLYIFILYRELTIVSLLHLISSIYKYTISLGMGNGKWAGTGWGLGTPTGGRGRGRWTGGRSHGSVRSESEWPKGTLWIFCFAKFYQKYPQLFAELSRFFPEKFPTIFQNNINIIGQAAHFLNTTFDRWYYKQKKKKVLQRKTTSYP